MQIDLSSVDNELELHELLSDALGFPEFYGKNWDAFYDSIVGLIELPKELIFIGTSKLSEKLPKSFDKMQTCFQDLVSEFPDINCNVIWS